MGQLAAGTLSYRKTSALPKLVVPHDEEIPADLTDGFLTGIEQLMLSQAQECCWQMAKLSMSPKTWWPGPTINFSDSTKPAPFHQTNTRIPSLQRLLYGCVISLFLFIYLIGVFIVQVGLLYGAAYDAFAEASPSAKRLLPSVNFIYYFSVPASPFANESFQDWLPHIQVKSLHFQAVAQFRKSMDEIETGNK